MAVAFAITMEATVYPHRLVAWKELGLRFEWLRLPALALVYGALGAATWRSQLAPAIARVLKRAPALWLLIALELVSTAWSIHPFHSFTRAIVLASTAVVGIYVARRFSLDEILTLLVATTAALAAVTVIGVALSVEVSMEPNAVDAWRGPFEHKNYLGRAMMIGCLALALSWTRSPPDREVRWRQWLLAALLVTALLLSRSTTSQLVAATAMLLSFYLPYALRPTKRRDRVVAVAGGAVAAGLVGLVAMDPVAVLSLLGKDPTLTGRSQVWGLLLPHVWDRPWLGYGHHAFWSGFRDPIQESMQWSSVVEAYNGYIELLLDCGVSGLLLFAAAFVSACYGSIRFYRRRPQRRCLFPILALFCYAAVNLAGSHLVKFDDFWWMLFCLVVSLTAEEEPPHRVERSIG